MDMFDRFINMGIGMFSLTRERAQSYIDEMVERGEIKREDAKDNVDKIVQKGEEQRQEFSQAMQDEFDKWRAKFGVVTRAEYDELMKRIKDLEVRLGENEPQA
ncbi:MAG: hypothetical protein GX133_05965 [Syntrophomonadaceae bacterium]|nr:hypothetical protein [Syntrophomonadaceae bacterium]